MARLSGVLQAPRAYVPAISVAAELAVPPSASRSRRTTRTSPRSCVASSPASTPPHATGAGRPRGSGGRLWTGSNQCRPARAAGQDTVRCPGCGVTPRSGFSFVTEQICEQRLGGTRAFRLIDSRRRTPMKSTDLARRDPPGREHRRPASPVAQRGGSGKRLGPSREGVLGDVQVQRERGSRHGGPRSWRTGTPRWKKPAARGHPQGAGSGRPRQRAARTGERGAAPGGPGIPPRSHRCKPTSKGFRLPGRARTGRSDTRRPIRARPPSTSLRRLRDRVRRVRPRRRPLLSRRRAPHPAGRRLDVDQYPEGEGRVTDVKKVR